jgi:uncharacterized membrane protein
MLVETTDGRTLTDLLTVAGSAGSTIGGAFGAVIGWTTWRRALEHLALGAVAGTVSGCLVAFVIYDLGRILG